MKISIIVLAFTFVFYSLTKEIVISQGTVTYPGNIYRVFCENGTLLEGELTWANGTADVEVYIYTSWMNLAILTPHTFTSSDMEKETFSLEINETGEYFIKLVVFYLNESKPFSYDLSINNSGSVVNYTGELYERNYENFIEINLNSSITELKIVHTFEANLSGEIFFDLVVDGEVYEGIFTIPANQTSNTFVFQNTENASQIFLLSKVRWFKNMVYDPIGVNFSVSYNSEVSNYLNSTSNTSLLLSGIHKQPAHFYEIYCQTGEELNVRVRWEAEADLDLRLLKGGQNFSSGYIFYGTPNKHDESFIFEVNNSSTFYLRVVVFSIKNLPKIKYNVSMSCGSALLFEEGVMTKKTTFNFVEFKNSRVGECQMKVNYQNIDPNETNDSPIVFFLFRGFNRTSWLGTQMKTQNSSEFVFNINEGIYGIEFRSYLQEMKKLSKYEFSIEYATDSCELSFVEFEKDVEEEDDDPPLVEKNSDDGVNIVAIVVPIACVGLIAIIGAIAYICWKKKQVKNLPYSSTSLANPEPVEKYDSMKTSTF